MSGNRPEAYLCKETVEWPLPGAKKMLQTLFKCTEKQGGKQVGGVHPEYPFPIQ